ncbi:MULTISPECIES: cytochrome c oxidase subunit 3 family protein [Thalassotalea]|uniref:Cytochrome c oxidase subunit 3 family protein n=1 Tax=Thalassotalea castellviae TaxID=3075612 RepID=A0ABU3A1E2_9GAMM|nr:cytochrome c oxidase subunit 3 family protein [Thalassotalea sp. W431]MDT0602938.1 cytochrome c oxidase subunit 3 family protein [Thalassotalea sp. W431]
MNNTQALTMHEDKKLPGDLAMWFFILAELTVFAIFFISFAVTEQLNSDMFNQGKAQLHPIAGLLNTLALITSSFFVALALNTVHQGHSKISVKWLITALVFAVLYLVVKMWEYQSLFRLGINLETNTFFTLYFLITAFHFLHVILGMIILSYITIRTYKGAYRDNISGFEAGASYWHMVDLLWIILFPLIYVI